jgi:hypothetical protein
MASRLAVQLDLEMLLQRSATIYDPDVADDEMPPRSGADVAEELGRRYLLRYLLSDQLGQFLDGSVFRHFLTPTPLRPQHAVSFLTLPSPGKPRTHVLVIDVSKVDAVCGPRWIRFGTGIEYLLPRGFPKSALVVDWEIEIE